MIDLSPISKKYPISDEISRGLENNPSRQYFNQGRELSLLINTQEGLRVIEEAESMLKIIVEANTKKYNLKMSFDERRDDVVMGSPRKIEYEAQQIKRQMEIKNRVQEILTGKTRMTNLEEISFIKLKNPDRNDGLRFGDEEIKQIELANNFFDTYGMADDYQNRQGGPDSWRIPGKAKSAKNRFIDADTLNQKAFSEGWKSVPKMIVLTPSG